MFSSDFLFEVRFNCKLVFLKGFTRFTGFILVCDYSGLKYATIPVETGPVFLMVLKVVFKSILTFEPQNKY